MRQERVDEDEADGGQEEKGEHLSRLMEQAKRYEKKAERDGARQYRVEVPEEWRCSPFGALVEHGVEPEDRGFGPKPVAPKVAVDEDAQSHRGEQGQETLHNDRADRELAAQKREE